MHPQPLPDELFSSWVIRAAHANGQKLSTLFSIAAPNHKNITKNIDNAISEESLLRFSDYLNTPYPVAQNTTLSSYEGLLFESTTPKAKRKLGVLHTGTVKKEGQRFYLQYCPACLAQETPYFRKIWRTAFFTVCIKHGLILLDRCTNCGSSIQPILLQKRHRFSSLEDTLSQCHSCGFDISKGPTAKADPAVLKDTVWFQKILNSGYATLASTGWIYSFSFFSVLRHLMRCIISTSDELKPNSKIEIEQISVHSRYQSLLLLSGVFLNWPYNFLDFCKTNGIKYYKLDEIKKANGQVPFWFQRAIKENLYQPNIAPSTESIKGALKVMKKSGRRVSLLRLNQTLGLKDSLRAKNIYKESENN